MYQIINNKQCVIFDFDGTIADTNSLHNAAFRSVFKELHIWDFDYEDYAGKKTADVFLDFFALRDISYSSEKIIELVALKQKIVRNLMLSDLKVYEGAVEFINYLNGKGIKLVIATSSSREGVTLALRTLKLYEKFQYIITGDDVVKAKPEPDIYIKALDYANVPFDKALVIEDSINGAMAATKANLDVIIVNNDKLKNKYFCTSFLELIKYSNKD